MRIPGERIKRTRLIQTEKYVIAVEVEMVIPVDDPSEPCYESETSRGGDGPEALPPRFRRQECHSVPP